jgi:AraC-like DNA-binding protein
LAASTQAGVTRKTRACVEAAKEMLVRRAAEPIKLEDVAAAAGCSAWHLARSFGAVTGTTIHKHLTRLRLAMGLEQLLDSREGVTSIAVRCGFSDHSHFTAAFRREYGVTPSQVRAMGLREAVAMVGPRAGAVLA